MSVAELRAYERSEAAEPLFLEGEAAAVLRQFPESCVDFVMTSPPYWGKRQYAGGGIGLERRYEDFIGKLLDVFAQVRRVLKPTGSFWLNLGDSYERKRLVAIPWRVAIAMMDEQKWVLRNSVIWNKVKGGPDSATDRLRTVHEHVFHFVKDARRYHYDVDAIRTPPGEAKVVGGAVVSATGVSGVRYRRQIELSTVLTPAQKEDAMAGLKSILRQVERGEVSDFRMIVLGQQRTTHSDSRAVSGRARELQSRGFYFLRYDPKGSKPSDVWDIMPEDSQKRAQHFAPYPEDLCRIPLLATCPAGGMALDPFCGTGTTNVVACRLGRKSVGIDVSADYIALAKRRCAAL